jgi:hypothetical protein
MRTTSRSPQDFGEKSERAYLMTECLVYIGVLFAILGAGYVMLYRGIDSSVTLQRNADDITSTLRAGERWRADVRAATGIIRVEAAPDGEILHIPNAKGETAYRYSTNAILRRFAAGPWICVLPNVKSFRMESDPRENVTAWKWEVELEPRRKSAVTRLVPLFTFIAVPPQPRLASK